MAVAVLAGLPLGLQLSDLRLQGVDLLLHARDLRRELGDEGAIDGRRCAHFCVEGREGAWTRAHKESRLGAQRASAAAHAT